MKTVIVSSKYQIVIPKEVREDIGLKAGTKLEIMTFENRIELVPVYSMKKLKGMFKGIDTDIQREDDRI